MTTNPLLSLTPTQLQIIKGERRQQLIGYLKTWQEHATLLRYLETWLGGQPHLATLRQARAETLLALGQPEATLGELEALDAERGMSDGRRQLRIAALSALGQWEAAQDLLAASDDPMAERQRGDLLVAQGALEQAAAAYARAGIALEGREALTTSAIEFAIARDDWPAAWQMLQTRYSGRHEPPRTSELQLERRIAAQLHDPEARARIDAELARREQAQREALLATLNLGEDEGLVEQVAEVPLTDQPLADQPSLPAAPEEAQRFLRQHWGYDDFRGQQSPVVVQMLAGQATLAVLPTGAGKSLTYQLPAFLLEGATVVVSPLIALMKDQLDGLPPALRPQATAINSTLRYDEVLEILREMRAGRYKLVYVAPERLRQQAFVQALRAARVARFVVDEAHCVSLWGLSFRPDYLFLKRVLAELDQPPVLALTATATPDTQQEIARQLGRLSVITASVFRANLDFSVREVANSDAKVEELIAICRGGTGAVVVYARAREQCERLAATLRKHGIKAAHYHAGIEDRAAVQEQFMRGEIRVLVATIAFGMGVDKADVRMIIHYNLPQSVEAYYQEAGRAGRDGLPAQCVLLYTANDKGQLTSWLRQDALDKDDLRAVYKALRQAAQHGFAALPMETLLTTLPAYSETQLRVMLGMLERVGLIVRHFDLPRSASLTLLAPPDDPDLQRLAEVLVLRPGQRVSFVPVETAVECGWRPDVLDARLLAWQAAGILQYSGPATDLLLELLPAPADTSERIDGLLDDYRNRQDARIAAMVAYAKGLNCRHRALAAHFGERLRACGDVCDVCAGRLPLRAAAAPPPPPKVVGPALRGPAVAEAILRTVRELPFAVGRTGLAHILVGSSQSAIDADRCATWGALAAYSRNATIGFIDALIEQGLLVRSQQDDRPLLRLSEPGRAALRDPEALPDLAPAAPAAPAAVDDGLYEILEGWRRETAQARGVPAYIVCANATLREIAAARPRTLPELSRIKGIGPRTLEQYGDAVLTLISQHG